MNDESIVQLFWEHSQEGVAALDKKYGKLLHRVIGDILGDRQDAEEVLSDTYMKL